MRAAFDGMDIVGVGENRFVERVGPLQRDFDIDALAHALEKITSCSASLPLLSDSTNSAMPPS